MAFTTTVSLLSDATAASIAHPLADPETQWRAEFERRSGRHCGVSAAGVGQLRPTVIAGLRSSLPTFQLGETGTGSHLLEMAGRVGSDDYVEAMRLFVVEEQEHARLLSLVCAEIEAELIETHWTDQVFQVLRRVCGLRAEVLILLVAEFVSLRFYEILADGVGDPVLSNIFGLIQSDERRHLDFHADTLPEHLNRWSAGPWWFARIVWNVAVLGSATVVAWDHRKVLTACGSRPIAFLVDIVGLLRTHEARFFQRSR